MSQQDAQNSFFLSGRPEEGTQTNYFRPKEVTKIVFPDVGMIMYPLFWVKYGVYLDQQGYDLGSQSHLFLWAERNDHRTPTEGILYYSLLGKYWTEINGETEISVGENAATEWLFEPSTRTGNGPYDELHDHFQQAVNNTESAAFGSIEEFTDQTRSLMSQGFRSICAEQGVSFPALYATRLREISVDDTAEAADHYEGFVRAFVLAIADAFEQAPSLHRKRLGETIIGSNISFTQPLLDAAPAAALNRLANTRFAISADEANAFLEAVQARKWGEYLVGSILLIATVGPFREPNAVMQDLRQLPQLYESRDDITTEALKAFPNADIAPVVREALKHLSYFWSVNYFLADGEDLARSLLTNVNVTFIDQDVDALFTEKATAETFEIFLELSHRDTHAKELARLIDLLEDMDESEVASFLRTFEELLGKGRSATETFIELLKYRDSIIQDGNEYRVTAPIQDNDSADFYGVREVINWTQTLAAAQTHE